MLLFGHTGITIGAAVLLAGGLKGSRLFKVPGKEATGSSSQAVESSGNSPSHRVTWLNYLGSRIDVRVLFLGSLLPDIIDKPVGHLIFRETISNGRIFGHTLLFLIIMTLAGWYLYRYRSKAWLMVISFGTLVHITCDQMWRSPRTLLWPVYGFTFPRADLTDWITSMLYRLLTSPEVYVPELVGVAVLFWFAVELVRSRTVFAFVKHGIVR
ncbi:metal-dependent hydrolase [Chloroflexota bacterium]